MVNFHGFGVTQTCQK